MSKRKDTVTEDDEHFVLKTKLVSKSTKKTVEIRDFISKIEDGDNNKKALYSPKFKLAGVDFSVLVYPDKEGSGFIGVYLHNLSTEDQTTSVTMKHDSSNVESRWDMNKVLAGKGWGYTKFLSHEKYRQFAKDHEDVLKLEVLVTLHTKVKGDVWTR